MKPEIINGKLYQPVNGSFNSCDGCAFNPSNLDNCQLPLDYSCEAQLRPDNKDIYYIEVKR